MSFGFCKPSMGVALGHRETSAHMSAHASRGLAERNSREARPSINPITGEAAQWAARSKEGCLGSSLVPQEGPTIIGSAGIENWRDAPMAKPDPTKNRNAYLGAGCVPAEPEAREARAHDGRMTASCFEGMVEREAPVIQTSQQRRATNPLLGGSEREPTEAELCRPRDQLGPGLLGPEKLAHPSDLPRLPNSNLSNPGAASGGASHLVADPETGFMMPREDSRHLEARRAEEALSGPYRNQTVPFRRAYGR